MIIVIKIKVWELYNFDKLILFSLLKKNISLRLFISLLKIILVKFKLFLKILPNKNVNKIKILKINLLFKLELNNSFDATLDT